MRQALAALAVAGLSGAPAFAQHHEGMKHHMDGALLSISAEGQVKAAPDIASISFGVMTQSATAEAAVGDNAKRMNAVMAALKKAGIADKDVQTSGLNLSPQYAYNNNEPPRLTGYQVNNMVSVTVRDLKNLGRALDAVVAAGANQINGVSFGLDKPDAAMDVARREAMAKAKARADLYAAAAGLKVARIVSISEGGGYQPGPIVPVVYAKAAAMDAATPVAPGEVGVTISVQVQYELK
jgi:uncharacterized protein YggE